MTRKNASDAVFEQLKSHRVMTALRPPIVLFEDLKEILNEDSLKQIISEYDLKSISAAVVVKHIAENSEWTKMFALLLDINAGNLIESFICKQFCNAAKSIDDEHLKILIPDINKRNWFMREQYTFFTPVFKFQMHYDLEKPCHLPFLENKAANDQGANSRIFEVTIPLSCLAPQAEISKVLRARNALSGSFSNALNHVGKTFVRYNLIRKELTDNHLESEEIRIHKELNHQCIIPLFASYRYDGVFNLLLPKCGQRMKPYLEGNTTWSESQYLAAIHGLSDAIESMHDLSIPDQSWNKKGCHGDLKPSNILVEGHKFILIDFGLSKIRQPSESSGGAHSMTGIYAAPECHGLEAHLVESFRACDIWSFGCILAELVVFMDNPGEKTFQNYEKERRETEDRRTTTAFHRSGQHKPRVWARLDTIENETHSIAIKGLIQLIRKMLQINYRERPDANFVTEKIASIKDMEQDPISTPDHDVQPAPGNTEEVEAVDERRDSAISPLVTAANQREAELRARTMQIGIDPKSQPKQFVLTESSLTNRSGQEVKEAYARFDQRIPATRKTDLDVILKAFLKAQADMDRPPEVFDLSLYRRIYWGLMVTEKELSHCRSFHLTERMRHIQEAERYCEKLQFPGAANAIELKIEAYVIKGLKARLKFKQGEDKDQTDREKKDAVDVIDEALNRLKVVDEDRFNSIHRNIEGWLVRLDI